MGNYSWHLSQNLSIENKHEFETILYQLRIVKRCEKQLKQKAGETLEKEWRLKKVCRNIFVIVMDSKNICPLIIILR